MIYVVSDIHGREDRFNSILKQIQLKEDDTLYILGDVIDRNPMGIELIMRIARSKNMKMIFGNHEYMMLDHLNHPNDEQKRYRWRERNGGDITYKKFMLLSEGDKQKLIDILNALPLNIEVECGGKSWLLVHGAPVISAPMFPYTPDPWSRETTRYYAVWHRIKDDEQMPDNVTVVFGHTPTDEYQNNNPLEIYCAKNRIGIDCGCAYPNGRLCCLRLDDGKVFYSSDL